MANIDIAGNIRAVELMKVELLRKLTDLFSHIYTEPDSVSGDNIANDCASLIALSAMLGKRLGVSYEDTYSELLKLLKSKDGLNPVFGDKNELLEKL